MKKYSFLLVLSLATANAGVVIDPDGDGGSNVVGLFSGVGAAEFENPLPDHWEPGKGIYVGYDGHATLLLEEGGRITNKGYTNYIGYLDGTIGTATVDGLGSTWNMRQGSTGNLYVGYEGAGSLNVSNSGTVMTYNAYVGGYNASVSYTMGTRDIGSGTVTVSGSADETTRSRWWVYGSLNTGMNGHAAISIQDGGFVNVTSSTVLAWQPYSMVAATVEGTNSYFATGGLTVGLHGDASLEISNGAHVESSNAYVGAYSSGDSVAEGIVTLGGTDMSAATWHVFDDLFIGTRYPDLEDYGSSDSKGAGRVNVLENGSLRVDGIIYVGGGDLLDINGGSVQASEIRPVGALSAGVLLRNGGTLATPIINGDLTVDSGIFSPGSSPAVTTVSGNFTQTSEGVLLMELGGLIVGDEYDQLLIGGLASFDGGLQIELINGFVPAAGDAFDLLEWGELSGTFSSLIFPDLSAQNLEWNTGNLYTDGSVSLNAIPEPGTWTSLLVAGLLFAGFASRRRQTRQR